MKKIAIIGAGFAGLAAAWEAVKSGYKVDIFEAEKLPGGLASGLKNDKWLWSLEHHYHHIFQTDKDILNLLNDKSTEIELFVKKNKLNYKNEADVTKTFNYYNSL